MQNYMLSNRFHLWEKYLIFHSLLLNKGPIDILNQFTFYQPQLLHVVSWSNEHIVLFSLWLWMMINKILPIRELYISSQPMTLNTAHSTTSKSPRLPPATTQQTTNKNKMYFGTILELATSSIFAIALTLTLTLTATLELAWAWKALAVALEVSQALAWLGLSQLVFGSCGTSA